MGVMGRHEDDVEGALAELGQQLEAPFSWHLHVQEQERGAQGFDLRQRGGHAIRLAHDFHLGVRRQQLAQFHPGQPFVIDQQGAQRQRHGSPR